VSNGGKESDMSEKPAPLELVHIRSIHYKGPQPGRVARVHSVVWRPDQAGRQLCMVAEFPDGEEWICPHAATKDYEFV
jgi:hypothetical protein